MSQEQKNEQIDGWINELLERVQALEEHEQQLRQQIATLDGQLDAALTSLVAADERHTRVEQELLATLKALQKHIQPVVYIPRDYEVKHNGG